MGGRVGIAQRLAAALGASALIVALLLAWQLRPELPALPRSVSEPLTAGQLDAALRLAAWALFVLLDLVLLARVIAFGARRRLTAMDLRLRSALAPRREARTAKPSNWRTFAGPLEPIFFGYGGAAEPAPAAILPEETTRTENAAGEDEPPPASTDGQVGVRLLGRFELTGTDRDQPHRKAALELIAYLALKKDGAARDELLEALWPDEDPRRSEQRFWQASTEARKLLHGGLRRKRDRYLLDRKHVDVDLDELERLLGEAEKAPAIAGRRELLERALALIRDEPLAGIDTAWAQGETRRLRALQVELLEQVGRHRLEAGEPAAAIDAAERGIAIDSSNERLAQLAMEAEATLGRRDAIIERYEQLTHELGERLGLEPERETKLLYRRLLSQDPSDQLAT